MLTNNSISLRDILCIDDDHDILVLVRMALEKIGGFHVETCNSGLKGIEMAESTLPDLILLDVMMPGVDGPSLLASIQHNEDIRDTPVVFMTARVQQAEILKYKALGVAGVIPKPFNPLTLSDDITAIWQAYEKNRHGSITFDFDDLHQQYLKKLPAKRAEIAAFWQRIRKGKASLSSIQKAELVVHNLAGSGGTYGYDAISKSALIVEEMLVSSPRSPKLPAATAKLLATIDHALIAHA